MCWANCMRQRASLYSYINDKSDTTLEAYVDVSCTSAHDNVEKAIPS
jgi:hypothetical protein